MGSRERRNERDDRDHDAGGDAGGEGLDRLRAAGEEFLAAGDDAIRQALSGDSESFLRANVQRGGQ